MLHLREANRYLTHSQLLYWFLQKKRTIESINFKHMGIFWELLQQSEIEKQQDKANGLEDRIGFLEKELKDTKTLLKKTLIALEEHLQKDIDGDGKTGLY